MTDLNMAIKKLMFLAFFVFLASPAIADYVATDGKFKGTVCKGFGIQSCKWVRVDAVSKDGKLFSLKRNYRSVSEYNSKQGLCHVRIKKEGMFGELFNKVTGPDFYSKQAGGQFKKVDIEDLSFNCRKN